MCIRDRALDLVLEASEAAGFSVGTEILIALDAASSEFYKSGSYHSIGEGKKFSASEMIEFYKQLCTEYPIISIEDPLAEDDWDGFVSLTYELGGIIEITR